MRIYTVRWVQVETSMATEQYTAIGGLNQVIF